MTARSSARSMFAWAFGICLSILFVSTWGRAMVADTDTLGESLAPLGGTQMVGDMFADWLADQFGESDAAPETVDPTVDHLLASPAVEDALGGVVAEVVHAAASPDPDGSSVDVRQILLPAVPEVTAGLANMGYEVTETGVRETVENLDPIVVRRSGASTSLGPSSSTATRLGTASLIAAIGLLGLGGAYVYLSDDRLVALRSLFNRVALSGLSFAVLLKLGSWVADPSGGRAPVAETVSRLAESQWILPLRIAVGSALLGGAVYLVWRFVRRAAGSRSPDALPIPSPEPADSLSG